ncbi:fumarate hydratase [Deltaproteobacteria bacterium OttesenSCG-928-K17]|nr:fumarate hydratase [Deltaproteobacteria bacterium OttesenSCG-928-K17]
MTDTIREINAAAISQAVSEMCVEANCLISPDIKKALTEAERAEDSPLARQVLQTLAANAEIAADKMIPICQDTGLAVVFLEIGQNVHIVGGGLEEAVNAGVAKGYTEGYLRASVVGDPIERKNTGDNTPAVIHTKIVPGDRLKVTVAPKGFGSENMSALAMLKPSQGLAAVKDFVIETVKKAGPNPCPPIIVGVGVGGTMEKCALLAKEALLRNIDSRNPEPFWAEVEKDLLEQINALGLGPAGFGGRTSALGVHINVYATHIAGLPVAVNIGCHVTRHSRRVL